MQSEISPRKHTDLYTIQGYDLREFRGEIDHTKGRYRKCIKIGDAQAKLYRMIGENQVIWFHQEWPNLVGEVGCFLHQVQVDERDIVARVNGFVWEHIIENITYIPRDDLEKIHYRAINSEGDCQEVLRAAKTEYLRVHLPKDLWASVLLEKIKSIDDQVLARFPFAFSKVVKVQQVSQSMARARRWGCLT